METGIGDNIWSMVPWAYSIRLCSYFTSYNANILIQKQPIVQSIIMMIAYLVISLVVLLIFGKHWEGSRENY